jgi:peptidyl-prolyl cis-trans isomerase C
MEDLMHKLITTTSFVLVLLATLQARPISAFALETVAKVNGKSITDADVKQALGQLNEGQRDNVLKDPNSKRQVVNNLIDQELLTQEGEKEKLDQDADYKEAMANFHKQYLATRVLQKNVGSKLTDAAAKKYYEAHKYRYTTDQVHAMHILVSDEKEAQDLLKKAKAKATDADFQDLAEKYSKDPSAKNNRGDLGFFGRDRMVPEFTDAAFSGKDGEIVGPIKTTYGYHIIFVKEKRMGKPLEFDEVELRVKNDLRQDVTSAYVSNLKKQAKVDYEK